MSLLIETIKCCDGKLYNLKYHEIRLNNSRKDFLGFENPIRLAEQIQIPGFAKKGLFRCRVLYAEKIEKIEFLVHKFRRIESLKLVEDNEVEYSYKYANRQKLNELFKQREKCDDILILKNGCLTDSYTANPVFFDGKVWWTPNTPLLPGTQRARMIDEAKISVCRITPEDLKHFQKTGLINAMHDLETMPVIPVKNIF